MQSKWKMVGLGVLMGSAASMAFVMPAIIPKAWADEQPLKTLQAAKHSVLDFLDGEETFFKPQWTIEDSVSTEVIKTSTVRKIEAGRTSFVTIATTSTGVYSSDGLQSRHVRYPGIHEDGTGRTPPVVAMLGGGGWMLLNLQPANSIQHYVPFDGGLMVVGPNGGCTFLEGTSVC
jgi:hypothetical protein